MASKLETAAYHKAGHAVMCDHVGLPIQGLQLTDADPDVDCGFSLRPVRTRLSDEEAADEHLYAERAIKALYAGEAAEEALEAGGQHSAASQSDQAKAKALAAQLATLRRLVYTYAQCAELADTIGQAAWSVTLSASFGAAVKRIADALMGRGSLSSSEVEELASG